jgi:hypothetical protein
MNSRALLVVVSLFTAVTLSSPAFAGIHLEPYLGYAKGDITDSAGDEFNTTGMLYGARLGYSVSMLAFGAEYQAGSMTAETNPDEDAKPSDLGVFVAFDAPVLVRVFATYFFQASTKVGDTKLEGTGMKVGLGFTPIPLLSINLEYMTSEWDEADGQTIDPAMKGKFMGLSVSVPLDL